MDSNVEGVIVKGSGDWLMKELPIKLFPGFVEFINKTK